MLLMKQVKNSLFYKPADAWAADFIPFYKDGSFHLFFLKDWRDRKTHGEGTPWWKISTKDFLHFTEHGEMLQRGSQDEQDLYVFTGSVLAANGQYHIFYTGCNPHFRKAGKPEQGVMHAVSDDLEHWTKIPEDTFFAPAEGYEPHDWRDPFVFWNDDAGEYWMLLAARLSQGPSRRRGCTALCTSPDLKAWQVREPFWSPGLYFTHECPDLFKMGNWWYLVYSTFSERMITHYRMSRSIAGPWSAPENDAFDGRAYYAAKTWSDGLKRYAFGWIPSRENGTDRGNWQWGGHLLVHELVQNEDGSLGVKPPETIEKALAKEERINLTKGLRHWQADENQVLLEDGDGFSCAAADSLPDPCMIQMEISFREHTRGCGIMLRTSEDLEKAYYFRLEPGRNRIVFDVWPRDKADIPFMVELERPLTLTPGLKYKLAVFIDDTACVVYINDRLSMSARLYDLKQGGWGLFVYEGMALFKNISVRS